MLRYNVIPRQNPHTSEYKYYAQLEPVNPLTIDEIAENISAHCTVTRADCKAVLSALQEEIFSHLREGNSVRLGDVGSFRPTISTEGVSAAEDFKASNIKGLRVRFTPSPKMILEVSKSNPNVQFLQVGAGQLPSGGGPSENGDSGLGSE